MTVKENDPGGHRGQKIISYVNSSFAVNILAHLSGFYKICTLKTGRRP